MENPSPPAQQKSSASPQAKEEVISSPQKNEKTQVQMKKEKRKKQKALKQFLSKPQNDVIEVPRRQDQGPTQQSSEPINCKICGQLESKKKVCQFCKDVVCVSHFRKKRKSKATGKFCKVCDECDDKMLYDKYMNLESKAEEALFMQEMIIQGKHDELAQLAASKKVKTEVLQSKKRELEDEKKHQDHKIKVQQNDITNKEKKFELKKAQLAAMEEAIVKLEESLPRPLDDDYNCLVDQNNKINKELLKFQKLCSEALKAKSTRQKQLYDMYYKWEQKQDAKTVNAKKKKEDCCIY